ncbi:tetratricopeptide repeat protein [Jiangella asiatica]|nr:tetratricopeptide repeat protein [Jiangella asiatica]
MARTFLTEVQVDRCDASGRAGGDAAVAAQQFESWAADPHPGDCLRPAELYVRAGSLWRLAGDLDRATEAFRRAIRLGGPSTPDPRLHLVQTLLEAGRGDEADAVAAQLNHRDGVDAEAYEMLAHAYQDAGRIDEAHHWFTVGVDRAERDDHEALLTLLIGRAAVRRQLDLPADRHDQEIIAVSTAILQAAVDDAEDA